MVKSKITIFFLIVSLIIVNISCKNEIAQISQENETKKYYTVSFDSDGGNHIDSQSIEEGKTATKPNNPIKTNFSFDGWYIENVLFDFSTPITADLTLKAKWKPLPDTTPPGKVENLSGNSGNGSVLLSWKNPSDTDFYKVEIIFTPAVQEITQPIIVQGTPGSTSSKLIEGLSNGINYTFTLVAVDKENNKSQGVSISVKPTEPADVTPPAEIINLSTTGKHNKVILTWTNPADSDFCSVEISATPAEGSLTQPVIITCSPSTQGNYTAYNLQNGTEYTFTIKTIDSSNNISNGTSTTGTPVESTLSLSAILPNDNGTIVLTNDRAPINVIASSSDKITKAVWRKSDDESFVSAESLLSDSSANLFYLTSSAQIYVTENGFYDIAVQNEEGICKSKRVEIKTIDKTPLAEVTNLSVTCNGTNVNISWMNPHSENEYDSPLKYLRISYVYNDNQDSANGSVTINSNISSYSFRIPSDKDENDFVKITVQTQDGVNNISNGLQEKIWCCYCIKASYDADEEIKNLPNSVSMVRVIGLPSDFNNSCRELRKKSYGSKIKIDLDLSNGNGTSISDNAFYGNINLRKVILSESITVIGENAFKSCKNLTDINIPASVSTIGASAFYGCESLETIEISGTLEKIGVSTFRECVNLKSVHINNIKDNTGLWSQNFYNCKKLETVEINSIRVIGNLAFAHCESLKEITLPDNCELVQHEAFYNCSNLSKITMGTDIDSIESKVFSNCPNLTDVVFKTTSYSWYKTTGHFELSTPKSSLNGTNVGRIFTTDSQQNARLLTQDYFENILYSSNYKPILSRAEL